MGRIRDTGIINPLDSLAAHALKLLSYQPAAMQPASVKPKGSQDRPLLQVGDFVKVKFEGEEFTVSVEKRIGNHVILSNGARFHILDDRWKQKELWIDENTGFLITLATEK